MYNCNSSENYKGLDLKDDIDDLYLGDLYLTFIGIYLYVLLKTPYDFLWLIMNVIYLINFENLYIGNFTALASCSIFLGWVPCFVIQDIKHWL